MGKVFTGIGVYGITSRKYVIDLRGSSYDDLPPRVVKRFAMRMQLLIVLDELGIEDMEREAEG